MSRDSERSGFGDHQTAEQIERLVEKVRRARISYARPTAVHAAEHSTFERSLTLLFVGNRSSAQLHGIGRGRNHVAVRPIWGPAQRGAVGVPVRGAEFLLLGHADAARHGDPLRVR